MIDRQENWAEETSVSELITLPFDAMPHVADEYEHALIALQKKRWGFFKLLLTHFPFLAPLMPLSLIDKHKHGTVKTFLLHFFEKLIDGTLLFGGLYLFLKLTDYLDLLPMLVGVVLGSLVLLYIIVAWDTSRPWRAAHRHLQKL